MKKLLIIAVAISLGWFAVAKAEPKSITPKEFGQAISSVPNKVANHIANEWEEIKIYQKANWLKMKDQLTNLKNKFASK